MRWKDRKKHIEPNFADCVTETGKKNEEGQKRRKIVSSTFRGF